MENNPDGLKKIVITAAAASAAGAGLMAADVPPWLIEEIRKYGPFGFLFLALMVGIKYYIPKDAISSFIKAAQDQAVAMSGVKDALNNIASQGSVLFEIKEALEVLNLNTNVFGDRLTKIERKLDKHDGSDSL